MSETQGHFLTEPEAIAVLAKYNIAYPKNKFASSADEAVAAATLIGFPVVLKIVSPQISHKSDVGGVAVNLADAAAVKAAYIKIMAKVALAQPEAALSGCLVCAMAKPGVEAIIGGLEDPILGPTVMFGLGGIFAEIFKDVSFRMAPVSNLDAEEMIEEIKGYPMLVGARGTEPCDLGAAKKLLQAVSQMMLDNPQFKELDLNPVRLYPDGIMALDVRILTT